MSWNLSLYNVHANESKTGLVTENCNSISNKNNERNLPENTGNYVEYIINSNKNSKARRNFSAENMATGTLCLHCGHNSEYRLFPSDFFVNLYSANGSVKFAIDASRNAKTKCLAISPSATSGTETGTFNAAAVTGIELQLVTSADAPTSTLMLLHWWSYVPAIANDSEITKIYGATTLNNVVREITNDGFGAWATSSITGNGQQSNAYLPGAVAEIIRAPLQFGKSGEDAAITIDRNIDLSTTSLNDHQSTTGAALINGWDASKTNSLTISNGVVINHVKPQIVTVFDVDSGVTFNCNNIEFVNALGFVIGSAFTGVVKASMASSTQQLETRAANIDNWQVTEGILAVDNNQHTFNNVIADSVTLINSSHTASTINITNSVITNVTNATNLAMVLSIAATSTINSQSGFFATIQNNTLDAGALPIVYNASASGITLANGIITVGDNANILKTTGGITVVGTLLDVSTIGNLNVDTSVQSSAEFSHTNVTFISGSDEINFSNWTAAAVSNSTSAALQYVGVLPSANSGTWVQYTPSTLNFTANSARWAIYNNSGAFIESGTGDKTLNHLAGVDAGTWKIISHRKGYVAQINTWSADDGTTNGIAFAGTQIVRPEGGVAYTSAATPNTTISISANRVHTLIGNLGIEPQELINVQQNFLNTDAGLAWIEDTSLTAAPTHGNLGGTAFFLNLTGFTYDSSTGATPESSVNATLVSSASHANVVTTNGGTIFGGGSASAADIAALVWASSNQSAFTALASSLATRIDVQAVEQQMTVD